MPADIAHRLSEFELAFVIAWALAVVLFLRSERSDDLWGTAVLVATCATVACGLLLALAAL